MYDPLSLSLSLWSYAVYCMYDLVRVTVVRITATALFKGGKYAAAETIVEE